ncbi:hypothetical protein SEUCBS139899_003008 [Sporothrix eucalyptigena]|uniref:Major facilitator superfamily (MFS) profile domain-containing protein n=1 Tax=Sporothrix eucalyptigena TaxID=1812306 RepID=A0ABP0CXI1_9PEZI
MAAGTDKIEFPSGQISDDVHHDDRAVSDGINSRVIFIFIILGFGSASMGYASSIIATTLSQPSWAISMNLATATNATALIGATNGLYYTGGTFGALFAGYFVHKYGRKKCAALAAIIILVSSGIIAGSVHIGMFITFRFFQGWGSFQMLSTIPMWMAELVPPKKRGFLVQIHPAMINVGYTVASYTGIGFYYYSGHNNQWRGPLGLAGFFPFLFLVFIRWAPESPRYLVSKNRTDEAWDILRRLHSSKNDPGHLFAKRELYQIQQQVQLDLAQSAGTVSGNYAKIFRTKSLRRRAMMSAFLTFAQMSSGALVINNYGGLIYESLGFTDAAVLQMQGGYQVCGWVMNTLSMFIIDHFPRNKLLSFGFAVSGITVIVEAALQKNFLGTTNRSGLIACAAMLFLNVTCLGLFVEGVGFTYVAEIWPTYVRGEGYAIGMASLCIASIVWLQAAPTAFANISWKFYIIFIVFDALAAAVIWFYPDTRGKPLEEIAVLFGDKDQVAVFQSDLDDDRALRFLDEKRGNVSIEADEVENARTA